MGAETRKALVPPHRLAVLLRGTRLRLGKELRDVASGSRLNIAQLTELENGMRRATESEIRELDSTYGVTVTEDPPERSVLVLDKLIRVKENDAPLAPDTVMLRYLAFVHTMRRTEVGSVMGLREQDITVLSDTFGMDYADVATRLNTLMSNTAAITEEVRNVHHRLLVPEAGVLIAEDSSRSLVLATAD